MSIENHFSRKLPVSVNTQDNPVHSMIKNQGSRVRSGVEERKRGVNEKLLALDRLLNFIETKVGRTLTLPAFVGLTAAVGFSVFHGTATTERALEKELMQTLPPTPEPERPQRVQIDERFRDQGILPGHLRRGIEDIFGRTIWRDVSGVEYYSDHLPMPSSYRGSSPFEAGHCSRSTRRGDPSHLVITIDAFVSQGESIEAALHTLIHELVHALDPENADGMPEEIRTAIRAELQAIVVGNGATIYPYVNSYEGGSPTEEQESGIQREELFAELVSDVLIMKPLPLDSSLRGLSFEDRMAKRLADNHNTTLEVTRSYARILVLLERWKGEGFIERGQIGFQNFRQEVATGREARIRDRVVRDIRKIFDERGFPGMFDTLLHSFEVRHSPPIAQRRDVTAIDSLFTRSEHHGDRDDVEHFRMTETQMDYLDRIVLILEADRDAYNQRYAQQISDPSLREIFLRIVSNDLDGGRLQALPYSIDAFTRSPTISELRYSADGIRLSLVRDLLDQAASQPHISTQDRVAFQAALRSWIEAEAQEAWCQEVTQRHPEVIQFVDELDRAESRYEEGHGDD